MTFPFAFRLGAALLVLAAGLPAQAQFALAVSPPRFELTAKPGERLRQVIELNNAATSAGHYKVKTADWRLRPDGGVEFFDALQPGSCRPWVAIERRDVKVEPARPYRFRFEVTPPPDTAPTECRFAVLIEGDEQPAGPKVPVALAARIGVIVYVAVGDVAPRLVLAGSGLATVDGRELPMLQVRNDGNAHGRLAGFLTGTDAAGTKLEFQPANAPVLPGETRAIALTATRPGDTDTQVAPRLPVTLSGTLEWGRSGSLRIEQRFGR